MKNKICLVLLVLFCVICSVLTIYYIWQTHVVSVEIDKMFDDYVDEHRVIVNTDNGTPPKTEPIPIVPPATDGDPGINKGPISQPQ